MFIEAENEVTPAVLAGRRLRRVLRMTIRHSSPTSLPIK